MKYSKILLLTLFLIALLPTPPIVANDDPFGNLPDGPDAGAFNPFEDEEDDLEGLEDMGEVYDIPPDADLNAPRSGIRGRGETTPGSRGSAPADARRSARPSLNQSASGGSGRSARRQVIAPGRFIPANSNEIVENFDYPDADILDVAKAISKLTGKNFIYNPQEIKGRISIVSEAPITVGDAWNAFLTALDLKNLTVIPSGKYLRIDRSTNAKEKQIPLYTKDSNPPDNDQYVTRVIQLKYISAKEVEQTFRLWIPRQGRMYAYEQTNTLIITDTATHINKFLEMISLLDVAGYQESLKVIPIRHALAKNIAELVEKLISDEDPGSSRRRTSRRTSRRRSTGGNDRVGGSSVSHIIADERTNAIIVKANDAGHKEIHTLIKTLDTPREAEAGSGKIHVIRLQFADAEAVAKTLGFIAEDSKKKNNNNPNISPFPPGFPGAPESSDVAFEGEIKVSPDKNTQSIVVIASPNDFRTIENVVKKLDIPRDQVFVESIIMETAVGNQRALGTAFSNPANGIFFPDTGTGDALSNIILGGNPAGIAGLSLGFSRGGSRTIKIGNDDKQVKNLQGLIRLLNSETNSNVIATPQIIAMDNEEAEIVIRDTIPIAQQTISDGITKVSFDKDNAELSLKVTPNINRASEYIRLKIEQKTESFDDSQVPVEVKGQATGKSSRISKTSLMVQNEDTVVISGLIKEQVQETVNKVPLLGDIPILGWLFKNSERKRSKQNLLVFLTPHIIKQYDKIRAILNDKLKERKEFLLENSAQPDSFGKHVRKLRERLPDLNNIEPLPTDMELLDGGAKMKTPTKPSAAEEFSAPDGNRFGE